MNIDHLTVVSLTEAVAIMNDTFKARSIDKHVTEEEFLKHIETYSFKTIEQDNSTYYIQCDIYHLVNLLSRDDFRDKVEYAGAIGISFEDIELKGRILDIGGGGEGIIGQLKKEAVVAIDPLKGELEEAPSGGLKVVMDARDLKFLDQTFDTVTSFFTLMYINLEDHQKVFEEIYRVLKPNGEFYLWDLTIPNPYKEKQFYLTRIEVTLFDDSVYTGYGTPWKDHVQNSEYFMKVAKEVGFKVDYTKDLNKIGNLIKLIK